MLKSLFHSQIALGFAQAAIASVLALVVILLARRRNIHLESDTAIALLRGIVQIVVVGSVLVLLLKAPRWSSVFLLAGMIIAAGSISAKRAQEHSRRAQSLDLLHRRGCGPGDGGDDMGRRDRYRDHLADSGGEHDHRQRDEHQRARAEPLSL